MPLFGSKEKKTNKTVERSESWSLGKSGLKNNKDRKNDLTWEKPADVKPSTIVELPTTDVQQQTNVNNSRPELASTESSKTFAAELDSSTISSSRPSHRNGESGSGSEPTKELSTRATSVTNSSPVDPPKQELTPSYYAEKEAVVSRGPIPIFKTNDATATSKPNGISDLPEAHIPTNERRTSDATDVSKILSNKEVYTPSRPESSIFSLPVSTPSASSKVYREYNFYNTPNFKDLVVCDPTQRAMFFAEVSSHTRSKADVTLRDFSDGLNISGSKSMSINEKDVAKARIVAVADYVPDENANQVKLGIGDPLDPAACVWVMMRNVHRDAMSGAEKFDMIAPGPNGSSLAFQWIRNAVNEANTSDESSNTKEAYRLICGEEIVASFRNTSMTNVRKRGSLRVYEGPLADEYLLLIFLSASAMSEMYRRRRCKKIRRTFLVPF